MQHVCVPDQVDVISRHLSLDLNSWLLSANHAATLSIEREPDPKLKSPLSVVSTKQFMTMNRSQLGKNILLLYSFIVHDE